MNINLLRLKPVVKELRGIRDQLERLADCWEMELASQGYRVRAPESTDGDPTVSHVDEELDWAHEAIERLKREDLLKDEDDE